MDWAGSTEASQFPQKVINSMVEALIARRGYHEVIEELIAKVYNLGQISLADPTNNTKLRNFDMWAKAVRVAILKHGDESTFENRISEADRDLAQRMGIIVE